MIDAHRKVALFLRFDSQVKAAAKDAGGDVASQCAWLPNEFGIEWMLNCESND
jgi:predicted 3-demethylubiquinone-9 3-methyltransferase (glyoxalase superfamily)